MAGATSIPEVHSNAKPSQPEGWPPYDVKVKIIIAAISLGFFLYYLLNGVGKLGGGGFVVSAMIFVCSWMLFNFFTRKVARGSAVGLGFSGFFATSISIHLPKTDEELVRDREFFRTFMPAFPAALIMFPVSTFLTIYLDRIPGPENFHTVIGLLAILSLTASPFFALKFVRRWRPENAMGEWVKSLIHAFLLMPTSLLVVLAITSLIDWMFFS